MVTEMAAKNKKLTYDELYCLYHNYVVLMLKTFMYTAYDDSARILSYLMDYKLCDTLDGLYCAGPDKEKISSVLSSHHVNHIISEYGEITKMSSYEDNRYEMYLGLGKNIGSSSVTQVSEEKKLPQQYNLIRREQKLYFFDEVNEEIASGVVIGKKEDYFAFLSQNEIEELPYDVIGSRLFLHRLGPQKIKEQYIQEKQARIEEERKQAELKAEMEARRKEAERKREEQRVAEQEEKKKIYKYLEDLQAFFFVHFTPISNLPSILKYGILPRSELNARKIHADTPDKDRFDNRLDYSSFSIAFPNYKVLFNKRCSTPFQYAVLIIDTQIILDLPLSAISYLPGNAASNAIQKVENYTGFEAVKALYAPSVQIGPTMYTRDQLGIPEHFSTNPQAEVFIKAAIAPQYIKSIKGEDSKQVAQIKELLIAEGVQSPLLFNNKINYNKDFYGYRL